jgi:hypothetical protein
MFHDGPSLPDGCDAVTHTIENMDKFDIQWGVVDVGADQAAPDALKNHPDRFIGICTVDPNKGMNAVRQLTKAYDEFGIRGASIMPAFCHPQVPIDDRHLYPVYAKCVELDIPVFVNAGMPGPRVPFGSQRVELLDEVCWFFPELRIVMRHGAEPWEDMAIKLMLKWPGLHYSTSGFAPKHYPSAIIDYANKRGAEKIIFAGYYAVGLTWDRIFAELDGVPLKDEVRPMFLRQNALRVLGVVDH